MDYIKTRDAAKLCCVTKETIQNLCKRRILRFRKTGKYYLVCVEDLEKYRKEISKVNSINNSIEEYIEKQNDALIQVRRSFRELDSSFQELIGIPNKIVVISRFINRLIKGEDLSGVDAKSIRLFLEGYTTNEIANTVKRSNFGVMACIRNAIKRISDFDGILEEKNKEIAILKLKITELERVATSLKSNIVLTTKGAKIYNTPLENIASVRLIHASKKLGITTIGELASVSYREFCRVRNVGRKTINEAIDILYRYGLSFDMKPEEIQKVLCS